MIAEYLGINAIYYKIANLYFFFVIKVAYIAEGILLELHTGYLLIIPTVCNYMKSVQQATRTTLVIVYLSSPPHRRLDHPIGSTLCCHTCNPPVSYLFKHSDH